MQIGRVAGVQGLRECSRLVKEREERGCQGDPAGWIRYILGALLRENFLQTGVVQGPESAVRLVEDPVDFWYGGLASGSSVEGVFLPDRGHLTAQSFSLCVQFRWTRAAD